MKEIPNMEIELALKGLPLLPKKDCLDFLNGLPFHGLSMQGHYAIDRGERFCPIEKLTDQQADQIEHELLALGIRYLKHWVNFQKWRGSRRRGSSGERTFQ